MKIKIFVLSLILFSFSAYSQNYNKKSKEKKTYAIVIHGGAGNIKKENISDKKEKLYIDEINKALDAGIKILLNNGTAVEAVEKTITVMEDSPLFNAGKGAVFSNRGICELDASIMDGKTFNAGAVAGVTKIKNPIKAARLVMEKSKHVLLSGKGANEFAEINNLEIVKNEYFQTDSKRKYQKKLLEKEKKAAKHGTVGCVVLDTFGNLAAGTSTGGLSNKKYGRIGDSPIIGAGTYANNQTCAVSCTGIGEFFIRLVIAHDISALMEYKNWSLEKAADYVINTKLNVIEGSGGVIAVDKDGNIAMPFNTEGMFRGYIKSDGTKQIFLYK